jgi:hypothetical protein
MKNKTPLERGEIVEIISSSSSSSSDDSRRLKTKKVFCVLMSFSLSG